MNLEMMKNSLRKALLSLTSASSLCMVALPAAAQVVVTPAPGRHGGACLMNSAGQTLCEGQAAVGTNSENRYIIRQLYRDGQALVEHAAGYQRGQTTRANINNLAPRVRCFRDLCEGATAIGMTSHNLYILDEVYASGDIAARYAQGYQRGQVTMVEGTRLAAEVQCLRDACQGDEAIGRTSGNSYLIRNLFTNGSVMAEFLTGYQRGQQTHVRLENLSIRVTSGRPPVVVTPPYDGGGTVIVSPPTAEGVRCRNRPCQVGLACIDELPIGATRYNHVAARGIYRILGCAR